MSKDKEVAVRKVSETVPQRLDQQIERLFDDFFRRRWPRSFSFDWPNLSGAITEPALPRIDVIDKESHLLVRAELPGMTKDDIEVSVSDNTVTLKGSIRKEEEKEEGEYHRREIYSQFVSRTVALPSEVDANGASAQLKDGMLEVTIPKVARAQRKRVEVKS